MGVSSYTGSRNTAFLATHGLAGGDVRMVREEPSK